MGPPMLRYVLATELRGIDTEILLSKAEYDGYSAAWRVVTECLAIEEAFGYVIADMLDLESVIHRHVLDGICTPQGEWSQFMDRLHELSRHVMHLLGSSEAYRDSTPKRLAAAFGAKHTVLNAWKTWTAAIDNSGIEARLWRQLRDLAHHQDSPIGCITVQARLATPSGIEPIRVEHTMALLINDKVRTAKSTRRRKKSKSTGTETLVPEEVPPQYDIRPLIQKHVSQLGQLHADLRAALAAEHKRATESIDQAIARFSDACGTARDKICTTLAVVESGSGMNVKTPLHRQWSDRYDTLQRRYGGVPKLFQSVITTPASNDAKTSKQKEVPPRKAK
jgi:hypothetical protein